MIGKHSFFDGDMLTYAPAAGRSTLSADDLWLVRVTISVWVVTFLVLCGRPLVQHAGSHSVFPVFMTAAGHWREGQPLYVRNGNEDFRYSPIVAAGLVPLKLLPLKLADFLWRVVNVSALVVGVLSCAASGIPGRLRIRQLCAVCLLALPLSIGSLNNAQSNPLVIGLLLISAAAFANRRWTLCAAMVVIATTFKLYPIAFGLLLMLRDPWKIGWRLALFLAVAALLPFLFQHPAYVADQYKIWVRYLSSEDRQRGPVTDWYRDFRAVWRVYISAMSAAHYLIVELAVAAAIGAVLLAGRLAKWSTELWTTLALSLACCWMTAFGPATESATYILLAPAAVWAVVTSNDRPRFWRLAYLLTFGILFVSQFAPNLPHGKYLRDHLEPLPVAGTLLTLLLLFDTTLRLVRPDDRIRGGVTPPFSGSNKPPTFE